MSKTLTQSTSNILDTAGMFHRKLYFISELLSIHDKLVANRALQESHIHPSNAVNHQQTTCHYNGNPLASGLTPRENESVRIGVFLEQLRTLLSDNEPLFEISSVPLNEIMNDPKTMR